MNEEVDVVDAEGHEIHEHGSSLERYETRPPTTLFGTDDPVAVIEKATIVASALADLISKQGLFSNISGKTHVRVEGWTLLGTMLGIFPVLEYCHPVEVDGVKGYEAKVNAKTRDGDIVGSAISYCMRNESRWKNADTYAISSMAQTRATSKALRGPLGFVVTMAGYEATPAEELDMHAPSQPERSGPAKQFDPATMLRHDAPPASEGWKGITKVLTEVDASIEWNLVIEQAVKGLFGQDFELKGAEPAQWTEALCRTANATGRLTELFSKETFLSLASIQTAFAEMFNGIVVEVKEFDPDVSQPLLGEKENQDGS